MDTFTVVTIVLTFTALAGWANDRFLRLPSAIGIMLAGLVVAGSLILVNLINGVNDVQAIKLVKSLHLDVLLIGGQGTGTAGQGVLLGILLFATALQIEPASMTRRVGFITWMATVGVILTALVTAVGLHFIMMVGDKPTYFLHLLLVGVILAPTDAVAAISLLRRTRGPGTGSGGHCRGIPVQRRHLDRPCALPVGPARRA